MDSGKISISRTTDHTCGICGSLLIPTKMIEGYVEGQYFQLHFCKRCITTSAFPRDADQALYDSIYKNADSLPGYWRYAGYARQVLKESDPLVFLSSQEDMYWAVARF